GSPPSSSDANASAVARLPTPAGPWNRYACAGPWPSAAARRPFASTCSGMLSKLIQDLARDLDRRPRAVDGYDSLRESLRELPVGRVDPRAEVLVLALDPVAVALQPLRRLGRVDLQQVRAVREDPADRMQVQLEHALEAQPARNALLGERGVEVAGADNVRAPRERRRDHLLDELRPRRREQCGLGPGRHLAPAEQELTDPLAELGAAGLSRGDDVATVGRERLGEELRLRRLARSVEAFERHKHRTRTIRALAGRGDRR